jgi:hypothetical protein
MVGATRRVARRRAARRAAPTFRNDEVAAQSCFEQDRWTFYEAIRFTIAQKEKERQVISNLEPPASDPRTKRLNGVASIRDGKIPFFSEKKSGRIRFLQ